VKQEVGFPGHSPGTALHLDAHESAVAVVAAELRKIVDVHVNVSGNEKVNITIAIVVSPRCPGGKPIHVDSGLGGDILELAVAFIAIQDGATETGDIDVLPTVIVEVGDGDTHAPSFTR